MAKKRRRQEAWKDEPDEQDFPAATDYLSLLLPGLVSLSIVSELKGAETIYRKAKDLMRASRLPLLPAENPHVAKDLKKVAKGNLFSPVLLVRGNAEAGCTLTASIYHGGKRALDEDADIPCRLVGLP